MNLHCSTFLLLLLIDFKPFSGSKANSIVQRNVRIYSQSISNSDLKEDQIDQNMLNQFSNQANDQLKNEDFENNESFFPAWLWKTELHFSKNSNENPSRKQKFKRDIDHESVKHVQDNELKLLFKGDPSTKSVAESKFLQNRQQAVIGDGKCNTSMDGEKPLLCYQCSSTTLKINDNLCDAELWKYSLKDELIRFRFRCPNGHGTYCVKKVQTKAGVQITERGCFGRGPAEAGDGSFIELRQGCVYYTQDGFTTSLCLCVTDECNTAITTIESDFRQIMSLLIFYVVYSILYIL